MSQIVTSHQADLAAELLNEAAIDAYHEGYAAYLGGNSLPYDPGVFADAWKEGRRDAQRASRRRVAMPDRAEGYYHSRLEAL